MRPSFELDPGLIVRAADAGGTERHTLPGLSPDSAGSESRPSLDGLAADFFAAGDEACFEPAEELEVEEPEQRVVIVRSPEQDARRARFTRVVAAAVGSFAALLAFGLVLNVAGAASRAPEAPLPVAAAPVAKPVVVAPALRPTAEPVAPKAPAVKAPAEAKRSAKPVAPSVAAVERPAVAFTPRPATVVAPAADRPALPSVASFAARAGDPVKTASAPPTASFAN